MSCHVNERKTENLIECNDQGRTIIPRRMRRRKKVQSHFTPFTNILPLTFAVVFWIKFLELRQRMNPTERNEFGLFIL